jgi:hypothetical protein
VLGLGLGLGLYGYDEGYCSPYDPYGGCYGYGGW